MKNIKYILTILLIGASVIVFTGSRIKSPVDIPLDIQKINGKLPSPYAGLIRDYERFIEAEIDTTNNVGAAVAIVCGDSLVFIKPYGVKSAGTTDSVNLHTVFRMASVSKGFAGVLSAILESENVINLNDRVKTYLPGLHLKDSVNEYDLRIKHILNHTTGLVPHAYDNLVESHIPMSEILTRFNEVDIAAPPGVIYGYQNALFSLIDTVLRVKTKRTYSDWLQEKVFTPLKMKDASSDFNSMLKGDNFALPHVYTASGAKALKPNKRYYNMVPAAGVNASISDMAIWLKALLGQSPSVIDSNIQHIITTPTVQTPLQRRYTWRWNGVEEKYYSLGWRIFTFRGYNIIYHGGYVKGYRAEIAFCPELKSGIVFLQNSPNRLSSESVPVFWEMYFDQFVKKDELAMSCENY